MTRIALINDDGTTTVGGVLCKLVPVEPPRQAAVLGAAHCGGNTFMASRIYQQMIAVTFDLSALPELPTVMQQPENDIDAQFEIGWNACLDTIAPGSAPTED